MVHHIRVRQEPLAIAQLSPHTAVASVDTLAADAFGSQGPSSAKVFRGHLESLSPGIADSGGGRALPGRSGNPRRSPGAQEALGEDAGAQQRGVEKAPGDERKDRTCGPSAK